MCGSRVCTPPPRTRVCTEAQRAYRLVVILALERRVASGLGLLGFLCSRRRHDVSRNDDVDRRMLGVPPVIMGWVSVLMCVFTVCR